MSRLAVRTLRLAVPVLALFAGGCASTGGSVDADIEELKARVIELQKKAAMAEVEIARLRQEVLASRGAALRPAPPPNKAGGTAAPPAAVAPPSPPPEAPSAPPPPAAIEVDDLDAEPAAPPATGADEPPQPLTPEAQAMYDQAYTLYHQGRYLDAETAFQRFLQQHGRTDLADNASFWIGECRFSRGDLRGALEAFRSTIERYPGGNKVADALLKSGQCLESLGDPESARAAYDEVIARFGDSAAAGVARARRDRLP
jgi:tol-pal system protein YbgF